METRVIQVSDTSIIFESSVYVDTILDSGLWLSLNIIVNRQLKIDYSCTEFKHFGSAYWDKEGTIKKICEQCKEKAKFIWCIT